MATPKIEQQARSIFENVKLMRERMLRAQRKAIWIVKGLGLESMTLPQMHAIFAVHARGEVHITELAEALEVSPASVSVMVDRLVEKGVLLRRHCEEDRRKVLVTLSPEMKPMMDEFEEHNIRVFVDLVERIGPETTRKWLEVFSEIRMALEEETRMGGLGSGKGIQE